MPDRKPSARSPSRTAPDAAPHEGAHGDRRGADDAADRRSGAARRDDDGHPAAGQADPETRKAARAARRARLGLVTAGAPEAEAAQERRGAAGRGAPDVPPRPSGPQGDGGPGRAGSDRGGADSAGAGGDPAAATPVRPVAAPARMRGRHILVLASFVLLVLLPIAASAWYLWNRAEDQYASVLAFSVRSEDSRASVDILGGLSQITGAGSTDIEILYQFLQSQELVERLDARLDLRALYARHHARDPVFSLRPDGTIEDLVRYWQRMTRIAYDSGAGLVDLRVLAFDPLEAQAIAQAVLEESTRTVNAMAAIARDDATRFAREELDQAEARLAAARGALADFRSRTQIVDPSTDLQGQMGVLNTLQSELASALVDLDLLRDTTRPGDPRITQTERRIEVISARLAEERAKFGGGVGTTPDGGESFATLVTEYERLSVEREFAERAYGLALAGYDSALAQAQRTSRYLAPHIRPTLAQSSRFPDRGLLLALTGLFLFLAWAVGALVYYSVRDRR